MDYFNLMSSEKKAYMHKLFQNCPEEVLCQISRRDIEAGQTLISSEEPCHVIYMILSGRIQAVDWCVYDKPFHFRDFGSGEFLGEVEAFAGLGRFRISAFAAEDSVILTIPTKTYMDWIRSDPQALFMRTQTLVSRLLSQTRDARRFMLLDAREKLVLYLVRYYEVYALMHGGLELNHTRDQLSAELGVSVKTVDRSLRQLEEMGYIQTRKGGASVTGKQYQQMRRHIEEYIYGGI